MGCLKFLMLTLISCIELPLITNLDLRGTFSVRKHNQSFLCNFLITRLATTVNGTYSVGWFDVWTGLRVYVFGYYGVFGV